MPRDLVHLYLNLWFVVVLLLFRRFPPHRAVIIALIAGALFLPEVPLFALEPGQPDGKLLMWLPVLKGTKTNVVPFSALLGVMIFDTRRLLGFRPRWFDLPMICYCSAPFLSAYLNGLSPSGFALYDAVGASRDTTLQWGIPYLLGRMYFNTPENLRDLTVGMVAGGLVYIPFCLWEMRFQTSIHNLVYGYWQHSPAQAMRGGFRPMVFMDHGLMVGFWMASSALIGFWLWWSGALAKLPLPGGKTVPTVAAVAALAVTVLLCKSTGALLLAGVGAAILFLARDMNMGLVVMAIMLVSPTYIAGRLASGIEPTGWTPRAPEYGEPRWEQLERRAMQKPLFGGMGFRCKDLGDLIQNVLMATLQMSPAAAEDRWRSQAFRLFNEDMLMEKAWQRPYFGWGGWGSSVVRNRDGRQVSVADGLWIGQFGELGFFGLAALWSAMLVPTLRFIWRQAPRTWANPVVAPAAALALVLPLYMVDCISNAMINPILILAAGALLGWSVSAGTPSPTAPKEAAAPTPQRPQRRLTARAREGAPVVPGVLRRPLPGRQVAGPA